MQSTLIGYPDPDGLQSHTDVKEGVGADVKTAGRSPPSLPAPHAFPFLFVSIALRKDAVDLRNVVCEEEEGLSALSSCRTWEWEQIHGTSYNTEHWLQNCSYTSYTFSHLN